MKLCAEWVPYSSDISTDEIQKKGVFSGQRAIPAFFFSDLTEFTVQFRFRSAVAEWLIEKELIEPDYQVFSTTLTALDSDSTRCLIGLHLQSKESAKNSIIATEFVINQVTQISHTDIAAIIVEHLEPATVRVAAVGAEVGKQLKQETVIDAEFRKNLPWSDKIQLTTRGHVKGLFSGIQYPDFRFQEEIQKARKG